MRNDNTILNEKCELCGLDREHCMCKTEKKPIKVKIRRKPAPKTDTCDSDGCGEGCSCYYSNAVQTENQPRLDSAEHKNEEHEHEQGNAALWQFVTIGLAAALLIAGFFIGGWLSDAMRIAAYFLSGYEVLGRAARGFVKGRFFDENVLMSIATIGAIALGDYAEAAAVMIFYGVGEGLQSAAVRRSRSRIADAVELHPDRARRVVDGVLKEVKPEEIAVGETILVKAGERVPLDGEVTQGESLLDVAMLTGEPKPQYAGPGSAVSAGALNTSGPLTLRVTKLSADSSTSRLLRAVQDATRNKPKIERFISRFSRAYTPAVIAAAFLVAVLPPLLLGGEWSEWIRRALIFLVISCPCALVLSIPLTFFAGLAITSKAGVLFKGADALERLPQINAAVFDKTGTLTEGKFEVLSVESATMAREELLALASAAEQHSLHPAAVAIARADTMGLTADNMREVAGMGVIADVGGKRVAVGSRAMMLDLGIKSESDANVIVAVDGVYAGSIRVGDRVRESAAPAMDQMRKLLGYTAILTGDNETDAREIAGRVGVTEVFASLRPEDKLTAIREIQQTYGKTLFLGDGMNDSPVLAGADIGIAMGLGGTDMAAEAADALLLTHDLTRLPYAVRAARKTISTARWNIAIALGIKTAALILGALGLAGMWIAILADVGAALICVLNTLTMFAYSKRI